MKKILSFIVVVTGMAVSCACAMRAPATRIAHNQVPLRLEHRSAQYHPAARIPFIPYRNIDVVVPWRVADVTRNRIKLMVEDRRSLLAERNAQMFDLACKGKINVLAQWFKNDDPLEKSLVLNQVDAEGRSLLIKAAQIAHLNFMALLLALDAYAVTSDHEGNTALNANPRRLTPYLVERLLEKGACVDAQDAHGNTALHLLAIKHNPKSMSEWSPAGENLSLCQSYHRQSVKHLLAYGANVHLKNDFGDTPYELAKATHNTKILSMFDAQGALNK